MLETLIDPGISGYTLMYSLALRKLFILGSCLIATKIILSTWETLIGFAFGNSSLGLEALQD